MKNCIEADNGLPLPKLRIEWSKFKYIFLMLKKLFIGLVSLFVIVAVGVQFVDWNRYKAPILDQVRQSSGYDVQVSGALGFTLVPLPALSLEGVVVKNPDLPKSKPALVSLEKLYVRINVLALLSGKIAVDSLKLVKPIVYLEMGANGQSNIKPPPQDQTHAATSASSNKADLQVNRIVVTDGHFTYVDTIKNEKHIVKNLNVDASIDSLRGPIQGDLGFAYQDYTVDGSVKCGVIADMIPETIKLSVNLKHAGKDYGNFVLEGAQKAAQFIGAISSQALKLPFQFQLGDKLIDLQKGMSLRTQIIASKDHYTLKDLDAQFDGVQLTGQASYGAQGIAGKLVLAQGRSRVHLEATSSGRDRATVHVRGSQLHDLLMWAHKADIHPYVGDALEITSQLNWAPKLMVLKGLTFRVGKYQGSGQVRYQQEGAVPLIQCDIQMPQLDLALLGGAAATSGSKGKDSSPATAHSSGERWSREPLKIKLPQGIEIKAGLRIGNLAYQKHKLTHVEIDGQVKNGDLKSSRVAANVYGGNFVVRASMSGQSQAATLDVDVAGIALESVPDLKATALKKGTLAMKTSVRTKASSMHDVVHNLNGTFNVNIANGVVEAFDVKSFISDLKQTKDVSGLGRLKEHFQRKKDLPFQHLKADFQIAQGVAQTQSVDLLSEDMKLQAQGHIDLPQWLLDLKAKVRFPALDQLPHLGVYVKGALDAPSFGVDQGQLAKIIAQGLASQVMKQVQKSVKGPLGDILGKLIPGGQAKPKESPNPQKPEEKPQGGNLVEDLIGSFMR